MKTRLLTLVSTMLLNSFVFAQGTIWNGPTITFTKPNNADWTQAINQDRITPNVWITRKNTQGIFNINQELGYSSTSPMDTEWAFGTTSNLGSLTFAPWVTTIANNPPAMVGQNMVVHLISDDIYIDIKFTSWAQGALGGGGFSYERSTDSGLSTDKLSINKFAIFPNPSNSVITLKLPETVTKVSVKVYDILGKEIYLSNVYQDPISVSNWQKGIYFIQVANYQNTQTKQFIKN